MFQTLLSFALGSSGEICNYQRSLTSDVCLFAQDNDCIIDINITFSLPLLIRENPSIMIEI